MVQNPVEFWKIHPETSRRISENNVSPDLIKLINYMLCPYPHFRLGIKQIRMQKWYVDNEASEILHNLDQNSRTVLDERELMDEKSANSSINEDEESSDDEEIIY